MNPDTQTDLRRDKLDIILRILDVGSVPVKKTHILYKAGINFYQLTRYLNLLTNLGLIEQVNEPFVAYRTTEKGRVLIRLFSDITAEKPIIKSSVELTGHQRLAARNFS